MHKSCTRTNLFLFNKFFIENFALQKPLLFDQLCKCFQMSNLWCSDGAYTANQNIDKHLLVYGGGKPNKMSFIQLVRTNKCARKIRA